MWAFLLHESMIYTENFHIICEIENWSHLEASIMYAIKNIEIQGDSIF